MFSVFIPALEAFDHWAIYSPRLATPQLGPWQLGRFHAVYPSTEVNWGDMGNHVEQDSDQELIYRTKKLVVD